MKAHIQSHRRGFTLVELMVAMAITTIMVTILISITSYALESWNRSRAEVRASRQAQAMTEIMARDFEAMVTRSGNNFEWFVASAGNAVGSGVSQSPNSADLIFFTAATDRYDGAIGTNEDRGGDISAVGYSLRFQDPMSELGGGGTTQFPTFVLYRKLVNPDETFRNLLGQENLTTAFNQYQGQLATMSNFVCENVFQFSVTFHIDYNELGPPPRRGAPPSVTRRSRPFTLAAGQSTEIRLRGNGIQSVPSNPNFGADSSISAVELSITVLTDTAMNAIRNNQNVSEDFLSRNSFQYSKRVEIPRM